MWLEERKKNGIDECQMERKRREEERGSCTWEHVVVFNSINVCLQAWGVCVHAFMSGICSTTVQDKCTPSLSLPVSGVCVSVCVSLSPHSASFHLFGKDINQVSG